MMTAREDLFDVMTGLRAAGQSFAVATVVRTQDATSAKAGAKAVITPDGVLRGWIGGGCAQGAVRRAALQALADGRARLVSVRPGEALESEGIAPGSVAAGIEYQRSACPSGGTVDVFIEPMLPRPVLAILGASPVARALCDLGQRLGFAVAVAALAGDLDGFAAPDRRIEGFALPDLGPGEAFAVVATQGRRDREALTAALDSGIGYVAFVGSRRKAAALKAKLAEEGRDRPRLDRLRAPAGLDIGAITPEEIALSILGEIVRERRRPIRAAAAEASGAAARSGAVETVIVE